MKEYISLEKVVETLETFNDLLHTEMQSNNYDEDQLDVQLRGTLIPECGQEPIYLGDGTIESWELMSIEDIQAEMNSYIQAHYDEPVLKGEFSIDLTIGQFYQIGDEEKFPCDVEDSTVEFWNTENE